MYISQNTDETKNVFKTELTNSCIYDKLDKRIDANPNDNYKILRNTLPEIRKKKTTQQKSKWNRLLQAR